MTKLFVAFVLLLSLSPSFASDTGGQDAGGGNVFEAEFKTVGMLLLKQMKERGLTESQLGFPLVKFEVALSEVKLLGTDDSKVELEGESRHAVNSPRHKIVVFTNSIWAILSMQQKRMLVLHEYLRFVDIDDAQYAHSIRIMELLKQTVSLPGKNDRTFKVKNVVQRKPFMGVETDRVYLDGKGGFIDFERCQESQADNGGGYTYAYWTVGQARITKFMRFDSKEDCQSMMAYLATSNAGMDVFVTINRQKGIEVH